LIAFPSPTLPKAYGRVRDSRSGVYFLNLGIARLCQFFIDN
jgi:hypothetical protein